MLFNTSIVSSAFVIWVLALLVLAGGVFDVFSTEQAIKRGAHEANPVMAWIQAKTGKYWPAIRFFAFAGGPVALGLWAFYTGAATGAIILLLAGAMLTGFAVYNNYQIAWRKL